MTNNSIDVIVRFRVKPGKLELYKQRLTSSCRPPRQRSRMSLSTMSIKMRKASTHSMSATRTKPRFIAIWKAPWRVRSNGPKPSRLIK